MNIIGPQSAPAHVQIGFVGKEFECLMRATFGFSIETVITCMHNDSVEADS